MAWNGLSILRALTDGPLLTRQLAAKLGVSAGAVAQCLKHMRQKGLVASTDGVHQIMEPGRAVLASGREITSGPCTEKVSTRRGNTLRAKAWRAMAMFDGFGLDDLLTLLCDGDEGGSENNLGGYLRALEATGYLAPMRPDASGKSRWRLRRDRAGREAPAWNKKTRMLSDPNTGEAHHIPSAKARRAESAHV